MKRLGLAVVVLALCAPGVEAKPRLSMERARAAITRDVSVQARATGAWHYRVRRCPRLSARRVFCAFSLYGGRSPREDGWATATLSRHRVRVIDADQDGDPVFF